MRADTATFNTHILITLTDSYFCLQKGSHIPLQPLNQGEAILGHYEYMSRKDISHGHLPRKPSSLLFFSLRDVRIVKLLLECRSSNVRGAIPCCGAARKPSILGHLGLAVDLPGPE